MYPIVDLTDKFKDNSFLYKQKRNIAWHWDAAPNAQISIKWLDERLKGNGTIVYNYLIGRDGTIYKLVDPLISYAHHTGKGLKFDRYCIGVAISSTGYNESFTDAQMKAAFQLRNDLYDVFDIGVEHSHHELKEYKPDFPDNMWAEMLFYFNTGEYRTDFKLKTPQKEAITREQVQDEVLKWQLEKERLKSRCKMRRHAVRRVKND